MRLSLVRVAAGSVLVLSATACAGGDTVESGVVATRISGSEAQIEGAYVYKATNISTGTENPWGEFVKRAKDKCGKDPAAFELTALSLTNQSPFDDFASGEVAIVFANTTNADVPQTPNAVVGSVSGAKGKGPLSLGGLAGRDALEKLEAVGLLVRDAHGRLVRGEPSLATDHEVRTLVVRAFHRDMIERAAAAVDGVPPEERDLGSVTVCIRRDSLAELKERLRRFQEELLVRCDAEEEPDCVYQYVSSCFRCRRWRPSAVEVPVRAPQAPPTRVAAHATRRATTDARTAARSTSVEPWWLD
jgi:hypothetical protein